MRKSKKILVLITHSLSELDVLFPLFSGVKSLYEVDIEMIITVKKIFQQYETNDFYKYCAKVLGIKIIFCQLPNKFDYRDGFFSNKISILLVWIYFVFLRLFNFSILWPKLFYSEIYMHEYTNQILSTKSLYYFKKCFDKKIIVYHHGHAIDMDKIVKSEILLARKAVALIFHKHSKRYFNELGFREQHIIGYPKFYTEWHNLVDSYFNKKKNIVLIFSRHVHPYYMDELKYIKLLSSALKIIRRKMGEIDIIIKPHPRESTELMKNVVRENNISNCSISNENATILAKQAKFVITFWGSVILDPLSLGIPAIEYYIEADRFREAEPEGSAYKKLGIHSTDCEKGLEQFIDSVIEFKYVAPEVVKELSMNKNLDFLLKVKNIQPINVPKLEH